MSSDSEKLDKIYQKINDVSIHLAKISIHQEQQRKEIDEHKEEIENLKTNQNKAIGAGVVISFVLGAIGSLVSKMIS